MEILNKATQLILSLSILVILHELGHFVPAKLFKTRVEKFYLFFNPWFSLFKFKKGETEYGIGWLPLGGYVKIAGMIDESMDKEQMKQPPQPYEFRSKKSWQRLIIMLGGIIVNFILGFVIYTLLAYTYGEQFLPTKNVKYGIVADSVATSFGFETGDKIISVNQQPVEHFQEIVLKIILEQAKTVEVERNGQLVTIQLTKEQLQRLMKGEKLVLMPRLPFEILDFSKNSPAKLAGLQKGDKVIAINNDTVQFIDQVKRILAQNKNQTVNFSVLRHNNHVETLPVKVSEEGTIGVVLNNDLTHFFDLETKTYSFFEAIPVGFKKTYTVLGSLIKQIKLLINPETKAYESMGGFISIGKIFSPVWDWQHFWGITAFLSVMLGIMNLLPIPALDGGHAMFLTFEIITGKKPSEKFMEYAQIVGMAILFALLIYANGKDIFRLF